MAEKKIFKPVAESEITKAIIESFARELAEYIKTDVIIVGGGPSGLMAGKVIAKAGYKVLLIEKNNYLGGGFWLGGFMMNKATFRSPTEKELDELGISYQRAGDLLLTDAVYAVSKLITKSIEAGVKVLNLVWFEDVVLRENNRLAGVVVNWTAVNYLPSGINCVDPIALESNLVIDASGHDAVVAKKLEERGLVKVPGCGGMWVEESEDLVVERTGEVHPGLILTGMAVSSFYALPRMGPTFGAMLKSGKKAGEIALERLKSLPR